ncbi:MAG: malonic semialdehyde reductase [Actinobacteria bacterium]|nr:malonic semialdehyde reductase [Actinomycetota bacterium]
MSIPATPTAAAAAVLDDASLDVMFREARSANSFSAEPVDAETLQAIYDLAKFGPTAMNTSPLRIAFVTTAEGKARLLPHIFEHNQTKATQAPVVAILAVDTEFHEQIPTLFPHAPERKALFEDPEFRIPSANFNAGLQMGYFIMAVRALGLAAGPVGGFDTAGVDSEFFADRPWQSKLLVNIGKPGENPWFDRLPRLDYATATLTF